MGGRGGGGPDVPFILSKIVAGHEVIDYAPCEYYDYLTSGVTQTYRKHRRISCTFLTNQGCGISARSWRQRTVILLQLTRFIANCKSGKQTNNNFIERKEEKSRTSPEFFLARCDFFPPPLTAPGSPRMTLIIAFPSLVAPKQNRFCSKAYTEFYVVKQR